MIALLVELSTLAPSLLLARLLAGGSGTTPWWQVAVAIALVAAVYMVGRWRLGIGRRSWVHAGVRDVAALAATVAAATAALGLSELLAAFVGMRWRPFSASALVVSATVSYLTLSHGKLLQRLRRSLRRPAGTRPALIIGAGNAGVLLSRQLRAQRGPLDLVGFVDDDPLKRGRIIAGLTVLGSRREIAALIVDHGVRTVAIAIPSASGDVIDELVGLIRTTANVQILIVPNLHELIAGGGSLPLTEVTIADLLGRGEVSADFEAIRPTFEGRRVLVTGAAGSIGSELCRQIARLGVDELAMLDTDETGLAEIRNELRGRVETRLLLRSIRDQGIDKVLSQLRPDIVVHAAAYKHVDILEDNPLQAVETNVVGTWNLVRAAERCGVSRFIFISSDKAVDPTGVLGASKRVGERMVRAMQASSTVFAAVRFGNVLSSRGSVIPTFERQIQMGGPITVTHPEVRRYFMSIPEAVHLVLQSTCIATPGRVYVLDMGEDIPIVTIAERLARLRGKRIPADLSIVFTGLRPGERLREELVGDDETAEPTANPRIAAVECRGTESAQLWDARVDGLADAAELSAHAVRERLLTMARAGSLSGVAG